MIVHKQHYLRGRTIGEIDGLLRAGAERVGVTDIDTFTTEVECLRRARRACRAR